MKSLSLITILSVLCAVDAAGVTTMTAPDCSPPASTPDVVTRSDEPTTPCTAPMLTAVYASSGGMMSMPTGTAAPTMSMAPTESMMPSESMAPPGSMMPSGSMMPPGSSAPGGSVVMPPGTAAPSPTPVPTESQAAGPTAIVPVTGAGNKMAGSINGILALAAAAVYFA